MLHSRSRSVALLTRALRRSGTARTTPVRVLATCQSTVLLQVPHRTSSSFVPFGGVDGSQKKPEDAPSFAIAAAFEGHEDLEDDEDSEYTEDYEKEVTEEETLRQQFQRGMEKKKRWMQSLATQKAYAAIVKSVADCYEPLYVDMGLKGKCSLLVVARDETQGEEELDTEYQPLRFDDMLTTFTETEALAILVKSGQPMLALAIVEHRLDLAEELSKRAEAGTGVVPSGADSRHDEENFLTLGPHLRMFYSWAMSAYALCGPECYPQMFDMYRLAQDAGVYPSANMNVQYISALIVERQYDELFEFYDVVIRENRPTSAFFYRQMLFAVSRTRKVKLLDSILEDMRVKGFKLRAEDYLRAMQTYDNRYFLLKAEQMDTGQASHRQNGRRMASDSRPEFVAPQDTYTMCVQRIQEQEENPERFSRIVDASRNVLDIFDGMVDIDGIVPRNERLFQRVITAAVYAQECERVPKLLALHRKHGDNPLDYSGVCMAVNALLLLEKPIEAWDLICKSTNPSVSHNLHTLLGNIFGYLCRRKRGAEIIALMHDVETLHLERVFTLVLLKGLVPALCSSVDSVSDEELVETMTRFDNVFRLGTSEYHFGVFLRECSRNKRVSAVEAVLNQWLPTSGNKPPLKGSVAKMLLAMFEAESKWAFMTKVFELTDFSRVNSDKDRETIVSAVSRAFIALGQPERVDRAEDASRNAGNHNQRSSTKQQQKHKKTGRRSNRV